MKLNIKDLSDVSNNSHLTNYVLNTLNEKLSEKEIRDFKEWLKLVKVTNEIEISQAKRKNYFR